MHGGARSGAGQKRIPDHIKLVKGTLKKERVFKGKLPQSSKPPSPPTHLNDRAVYYFHLMIQRMEGRASETYTEVLALLAMRLEEQERFYQIIYDNPFFETCDKYGNPILKPHPVAALYKESMRHAHTLLIELGLTPSSIARVAGKTQEKEADPWDDL